MMDIIKKFIELEREEQRIRDEHKAVIRATVKEVEAADERVRKAEAYADKLKKRLEKLTNTDWIDAVIQPIAKELAARAGLEYKVYGPFDLSCEAGVYLFKDKDKCITKQPTRSKPHHEDGYLVIRYRTGETTDEYKPGTIEQVNGFNCVTEPLPDIIEETEALLTQDGDDLETWTTEN